MTTEFEKFNKIPRLNREVIITEKIDGTNAQILVTEDGHVLAGSRNRWITPGKTTDNHGFAMWVQEHRNELAVGLGPGRHYGEWYGQSIARNYGLDHRRFALFNVGRWLGVGADIDSEAVAPPACCSVVPILAVMRGPFDTKFIDQVLWDLRREGSLAVEGWARPEGIVLFHTQSGHLFKVTLENDEKPKGAPAWA